MKINLIDLEDFNADIYHTDDQREKTRNYYRDICDRMLNDKDYYFYLKDDDRRKALIDWLKRTEE